MQAMRDIFEEASRLDGPLGRRLAVYAEGLRANAPEIAEAYEAFVSALLAHGSGRGAPGIGDPFPEVMLPDDEGRLTDLASLAARGPLVVSFERGHWCSFCRLEAAALAGIGGEIEDRGGSLVAITPELAGFARSLKASTGLACPVLSDLDLGAALTLGLAVPVDDRLRDVLLRNEVDLPLYQGSGQWLLPIPATFVVGANGRILARHVEADFRKRMEPQAVLDALGGIRRAPARRA